MVETINFIQNIDTMKDLPRNDFYINQKQLDFIKTRIKHQNSNILDRVKLFTDLLRVVSQTVNILKAISTVNHEGNLTILWLPQ